MKKGEIINKNEKMQKMEKLKTIEIMHENTTEMLFERF